MFVQGVSIDIPYYYGMTQNSFLLTNQQNFVPTALLASQSKLTQSVETKGQGFFFNQMHNKLALASGMILRRNCLPTRVIGSD